jgi:FtsH-binding integral membrane protein
MIPIVLIAPNALVADAFGHQAVAENIMREMVLVSVGLVAAVIGAVVAYFVISPDPAVHQAARNLGHMAPALVVVCAALVGAMGARRRRSKS